MLIGFDTIMESDNSRLKAGICSFQRVSVSYQKNQKESGFCI